MTHAGDWVEEKHRDYIETPDMITLENYHKLHVTFEDWARKKRLGADAQDNAAMEIGKVDGAQEEPWARNNP